MQADLYRIERIGPGALSIMARPRCMTRPVLQSTLARVTIVAR